MATQADLLKYEAWLKEAEEARHELAIGDKTRVIWRLGGNRREFYITDLSQLEDYIVTLRKLIRETKEELGETTGRRRWAIGVRF